MNCFKFDDKNSYLDAVKSLSNEEIELERLSISNLLAQIQYDYNMFRSNLFVNYISKAYELAKSNDESFIKTQFKKLLIDCIGDANKFAERLNQYKEYDDSNNYFPIEPPSTELALEIIGADCDRIINSSESGYLDMLKSIINYSINYPGIVLYKLYKIRLIDKSTINTFKSTSNLIFAGPDEKGEIDYKYASNRFWHQMMSNIDTIEHCYQLDQQ